MKVLRRTSTEAQRAPGRILMGALICAMLQFVLSISIFLQFDDGSWTPTDLVLIGAALSLASLGVWQGAVVPTASIDNESVTVTNWLRTYTFDVAEIEHISSGQFLFLELQSGKNIPVNALESNKLNGLFPFIGRTQRDFVERLRASGRVARQVPVGSLIISRTPPSRLGLCVFVVDLALIFWRLVLY